MILFFYGEDSYRSFQKLKDLKIKYVDASLGDTNLTTIDAAAAKPADLAGQLFALPFLAKTRLVVLPELLSKGKKELQEKVIELLPNIPETTVAVIYEPGVPDRRSRLFKALAKEATVQEFTPLAGRQRSAWIGQELSRFGATITPDAEHELAARASGDTWALATELAKLATAVSDRPAGKRIIDRPLVEALVARTPTEAIFALTDAYVAHKPARALSTLRTLLAQGENEQALVGLVASSLRSLLLIRDALDHGHTSQAAIAQASGLKPFVVGKHLAAAQKTSSPDLVRSFQLLADLDVATKTGMIGADIGLELFLLGKLNLRRPFLLNEA